MRARRQLHEGAEIRNLFLHQLPLCWLSKKYFSPSLYLYVYFLLLSLSFSAPFVDCPRRYFILNIVSPPLLIAQKGILSLRKKTGRVKTRKEFCKIAFDGAKGDRGNNFCNQAKVKGTISSSPGLGTHFNFWLVWRNFTSDIAILKDIW